MNSDDEKKELDPVLQKKKQREQEFFNEIDDFEERHQLEVKKKKKMDQGEVTKLEIPGPAGDVLDFVKKSNKSLRTNTQISQIDKNEFDKKPWKEILEDVDITFNIHKLKKEHQVKKMKEKMAFIIKNVIRFEIDALVSLLDPSGEIEGTISKEVIELHPKILSAGTAILVESCSIFSPSPIVSHIIITKKNLKKVVTVESTRSTARIVNYNGSQDRKKVEKKPELFKDLVVKDPKPKERQITLTAIEKEKEKEKEIVKETPKTKEVIEVVQKESQDSQRKSHHSSSSNIVLEPSNPKTSSQPKSNERSSKNSLNSWKGPSVLESEEKLDSLKESFGAFDEDF